jgi:hypothetical protein
MRTLMTWSVAIALLAIGLPLAGTADAQDWKIYTIGKSYPIEADFYAEDAPWVFYRYVGDPSMYVFTIGCNRVLKVERTGQEIPRPSCPVESVPTNQTRVYSTLLELEGKRLDEAFERLRGMTVQFNRAAADATITLANARATGENIPTATLAETLQVLNRQLDEVRSDLTESLRRTDAVVTGYRQYRDEERRAINPQRYFFAPR